MSQILNGIRIQVRITNCTINRTPAPACYSFLLSAGQNIASKHAPWRNAFEGSVTFNSFLKIEVAKGTNKCKLTMLQMRDGKQQQIGCTSLLVSTDKCMKVRKYPIKKNGVAIAVVSASLYLSHSSHESPTFDKGDSDLSQYQSLNSLRDVDSFIINPSTHQMISKRKTSQGFKIIREVNMEITQNQSKKASPDALLSKLFSGIDRKKEEISKRQMELQMTNAQLQHIRMKDHILQQKEKKIHQLKQNNSLLIQANSELINKDNRYDEEYILMKQQKQTIQQQIATINSQASLKIMCLQNELQSTNKKLLNRDSQATQLINQVQKCSKQLNALKTQNKQKIKIMKSLSQQLQVETKEDHHEKGEVLQSLLSLLANHFEKENPPPQQLPQSHHQKLNKSSTSQNLPHKKYRATLSASRSNHPDKDRCRQRFREGKKFNETSIAIPTILECILQAASQHNMGKLLL